MNYRALLLIAATTYLISSCKNEAPFAIDEHPTIKIDTNLLGVWQADDALFKDYLLVQSYDDVYSDIPEQYRDDSAIFPQRQYKDCIYYITEVDKDKAEMVMIAFQSSINKAQFINVGLYESLELRRARHHLGPGESAFTFMQLKRVNKAKNKLVLVSYGDTSMTRLKSATEVRRHITANINKRDYLKDSAVFTKISGDHIHKRKY